MTCENPDGSLSFSNAIYEDTVHDIVEVASQDQWCDFHYSTATSGNALEQNKRKLIMWANRYGLNGTHRFVLSGTC
jgi:hypothetical protein